jgi:hypothetical protein
MRAKGAALDRDTESGMKGADWQELWNWAHPNAIEAFVEIYQDDGEEEESEGGDEDEEEGGVELDQTGKALEERKSGGPPMKLNDLMKFASVGITAPSRPGG